MARVLLVGENNPYGDDPGFALYPLPERASGGRLCRILGVDPDRYLSAFDRVNLLQAPRWSIPRARQAASALITSRGSDELVLLGAKVARAFCMPFIPFRVFAVPRWPGARSTDGHLLILPHPSGLCRLWGDPQNVRAARRAVAGAMRRARA